jgi:hypothetical protein
VVDGVPRLVYELHLTNFVRDALVPRRVEVLDADGDAVIAEISGDALDVALEAPAGSSADHAGGIAPGVPWSPIEGMSTTTRTRELPAPNVVVDFGS